jgi:hypothetical protein
LDELMREEGFNDALRALVRESGRG